MSYIIFQILHIRKIRKGVNSQVEKNCFDENKKHFSGFRRETQARVRENSIEEFGEIIENHDDLLVVDVRKSGNRHVLEATVAPTGLSFRLFYQSSALRGTEYANQLLMREPLRQLSLSR